jgi:phage terminase large subunit-like protein
VSLLLEEAPREEAYLLTRAIEAERKRRAEQRTIATLFPETGPYRRELYPKHLEFFKAGAHYRQRLFIAANRVGKSLGGGFEDTLHLTGLYDRFAPWWEGRRFTHPVKVWVCGTTGEEIKDTLQEQLLGPVGRWGTGLIPGETILKIDRAVGPVHDLVDTVRIKHVSGGESQLQFKSYKQGRKGYEGTHRHVIHGDEEMPADIKAECLLRTMDTTGEGPGILLFTFTPMQGLSETVLEFLPDGQLPVGGSGPVREPGEQAPTKYVVNATWDDVPHLSEAEKTAMEQAIPSYQRDARKRGLPILGAGVIYPVSEDEYVIEPGDVPKHWRRAYGMDVGWNWTAAVWCAYDQESDREVVYHVYKRGEAEPSIHATAIKAPGPWMSGVIDPAASGRSQHDGERLLIQYRKLGLRLTPAKNAVEAGLYEVWERLSTGRLKIMRSCLPLIQEMRLYRRDEQGRVVKVNDHLCDALRYRIMSGRSVARAVPVPKLDRPHTSMGAGGWMR